MRICHITSSLSRLGGGVATVVWALGNFQKFAGANVTILGLNDTYTAEDIGYHDIECYTFDINGPRIFGYSRNLNKYLSDKTDSIDIIHSHGLWMYQGYAARRFAQRGKIPLVISPHGMLEPWAFNHSKWKKRIVSWLFENNNLKTAACLHVCESEYENIRRLGLRNPVAILPNGVDLKAYKNIPKYNRLEQRFPVLQGLRRALFISRIHPKKGLAHLLRAWAALHKDFKNWMLLIVGSDQLGHKQEMETLARNLGIENVVIFSSPLYDDEKIEALAGSDIFLLPSFSEGFSMIILDAAACGLPILLTPQCNFPELAKYQAAVEVKPNEYDTERGLRLLMNLSDTERKAMGKRGRNIIKDKYNWPPITKELLAVYDWLLGNGAKPDCVRLD